VRLPAARAARLPGVSFSAPQVISGFSSSPSVSTKSHGRRDEPAPDGSTELACRPVTGRLARTGRVSRWWRVPAGTHPWVALAVMTPVPGTASIGDADTTPSHTDGPVGSQNEGIPMVGEQFVPRRAVRFGDRGGRGVHVHLRPEMGALMLWPSASAVGWLLMMTALIVLARSGTARWEREQERGAGTEVTRPPSEPTTGPAPSRGSPGR
jgi:hypothetical protein